MRSFCVLAVLSLVVSLCLAQPANTNECVAGFAAYCKNGATCTDPDLLTLGAVVCTCPAGFSGPTCSIVDECVTSNPCKNGAVCTDSAKNANGGGLVSGGVTCACKTGYSGVDCSIINECAINNGAANPCKNGGNCLDTSLTTTLGSGTLTCGCANGFSGTLCELENECLTKSPCLNGGICTDANLAVKGGISCVCNTTLGYSGNRCQNEDECKTRTTYNPAYNKFKSATLCNGKQLYVGASNVINGSNCVDLDVTKRDTYVCTCATTGTTANNNPGISGRTCELQDECKFVPNLSSALFGYNLNDLCGVTYSDYVQVVAGTIVAPAPLSGAAGKCVDSDLTTIGVVLTPSVSVSGVQCVCNAGFSTDSSIPNIPINCFSEDECLTKKVVCANGGQCTDPNKLATQVGGVSSNRLNGTGASYFLASGAFNASGTDEVFYGPTCSCPIGFYDPVSVANGVYSASLSGTPAPLGNGTIGCSLEDECASSFPVTNTTAINSDNLLAVVPGPCGAAYGQCTDLNLAKKDLGLFGVAPGLECNCAEVNSTSTLNANTKTCTKVSECLVNPCAHGEVCTDPSDLVSGDFSCACDTVLGYSGQTCSDENECVTIINACQNGGFCQDADVKVLDSYTCACAEGFSGDRCETVGAATTSTSTQATTTKATTTKKSTASKASTTKKSTTKKSTTTKKSACEPSPCGSNGTCNVLTGNRFIKYTCSCFSGWTGNNCQTPLPK